MSFVRHKPDLTDLFLHILKRNDARLRGIARKHAAPDDFYDLYQEILLQVWRSLMTYEARAKLDTWVYRVALNTARDFKRKAVRRRSQSPDEFYRTLVPSLRRVHAPRSQSRMLLEFADSLRESDRTLFLLFLQGLSYQQLSEITGLDRRHVRVRISRIKRMFLKRYIET